MSEYDYINGYNAEDEVYANEVGSNEVGSNEVDEETNTNNYDADTEEDDMYDGYEFSEYVIDELNAQKRDEFIYTRVFNNYNIPTETPIDFSMGDIEQWGVTCSTFNNQEKGSLTFATIYIVYDTLICNNIHPFIEVNKLADLFNTHAIHD